VAFSRSGDRLTTSIPTDIPEKLIAGDTWRWTVRFDDYLASDGWTLKYYLRGVGSQDITAIPDTDGEGYSITLAAATTGALAAGNYQFLARVSNVGLEAYTVDSGVVLIAPNAATAAAGALQSHAEQMVALLRAEIKARLSGTAGTGHNDYAIDGRSISKFSLAELRGMLKGYELELSAQKNGGRLPPYRVGFSRA
jgi:hypothetical protein